MIFKEGTPGDFACVLKDGRVEIFTEERGSRIVLAVLKPVSVFGEMAVILPDSKRTACAKALEYSEVMLIDRAAFNEYIEKSPQIVAYLVQALVERLQKTNARLINSPDIFVGTCEILNLLAMHGAEDLLYEQTARSIANALNIDIVRVKEKIALLSSMNMLAIQKSDAGKTYIRVLNKSEFLANTRRIYHNSGGQL